MRAEETAFLSAGSLRMALAKAVRSGFRHLAMRGRLASFKIAYRRETNVRQVFDLMPEAAFILGADGDIRDCNRTALQEFGYSRRELIGGNIDRLWIRKQGSATKQQGWAKHAPSDAIVGIRKDRTNFPATLTSMANGDGGSIAIVQVVTTASDTETRVEELQAELSRLARLYQLGDMASVLAHELAQPIGAIANYSQGCSKLLDEKASANLPQLPEALQEITQNALRAGEIIRQLRDYMGRDCGDKRPEHVDCLIGEAMKLALVGSNIAAITTAAGLDAERDLVLVNRVQIEQVLINIIRNAVEAMDSAEDARLTIAAYNTPDDMIVIEVSDNGPGLSAEIESRLFKPFVTTKPHGLGIGLAMSKRIIEAHGGQILARRAEGRGAVFEIALPLTRGLTHAQ